MTGGSSCLVFGGGPWCRALVPISLPECSLLLGTPDGRCCSNAQPPRAAVGPLRGATCRLRAESASHAAVRAAGSLVTHSSPAAAPSLPLSGQRAEPSPFPKAPAEVPGLPSWFRLGPRGAVAGRHGAPSGWAGATSSSLDLRSEGGRGGTLRDNAQVLTTAMTTYTVTPCPGTSMSAPTLRFWLRGRDHTRTVPGPRTSWPGWPAPSCGHTPQIHTHGEHSDSLGHSRGHREARIEAGGHLHGSASQPEPGPGPGVEATYL